MLRESSVSVSAASKYNASLLDCLSVSSLHEPGHGKQKNRKTETETDLFQSVKRSKYKSFGSIIGIIRENGSKCRV